MEGDKLWGGMDLGNESVSLCITDHLGVVQFECDVEARPEPISEAIQPIGVHRLEAIAVEAGGGGHLVRRLRALGLPIVVLETRKASKVLTLRRHKTDANDARGLADIARMGGGAVSRVHDKSPESRHIRMQLTLRQQIVKQRVAGEHVIRNMLQEIGGDAKSFKRASGLRKVVDIALSQHQENDRISLKGDIDPLLSLCESMREYESKIDRRLLTIAKNHPICQRFLQVPSIGPIAALSFYSAIDDPHRFTRTEDVACYLGLTPRIRESGKYTARPRISKMGNTMTRTHLTMSSEVLLNVCRKDSTLRRQALALKARVGFRKARVAMARKLSIVLLSLWKSGLNYEPFSNLDRVSSLHEAKTD